MCGIVAALAPRPVLPVLMAGLRSLEYRGYDSAGVALIEEGTEQQGQLFRVRSAGRVRDLEQALAEHTALGQVGIAHTRWATHGVPSERNAHPLLSDEGVAVVCNGIIENHEALRRSLQEQGFTFTSDTDTEVICHLVVSQQRLGRDFVEACRRSITMLEGSYALAILSQVEPDLIVAARRGSPLVAGLGEDSQFLASDMTALLHYTRRFLVLEEGDFVILYRDRIEVENAHGERQQRSVIETNMSPESIGLNGYRHYMLKEIYEQPRAALDTLEGRIINGQVPAAVFGPAAEALFSEVDNVKIIACGTSYHAGLVAKHWMEGFGIACDVEIASEFRYRQPVVPQNNLLVAISQSGETVDILAAVKAAKERGFGPLLAICNVAESALLREAELVLLTRAGPEIGVASTKAFTTQLVGLYLLTMSLAVARSSNQERVRHALQGLAGLPALIERALGLEPQIKAIAEGFVSKEHALFLGRGSHYPIALEGALKLKEISYIHAEAYPAGELKHGPLALVDERMPVIAVAPNNPLLEKLKSNIQEVRARGGRMLVFADQAAGIQQDDDVTVVPLAPVDDLLSPIVYAIPLQLLAYHVALIKGTDVDKPRNLAKSVTVE
ncbi:MAG TPA: glutamine--fructose-6-phosphate transaminase (isomerizing) [Gammaproteobacteria bacterium]|nr:glutamine--fructose-6-phosphate transaminase (isomerizing) [Gammaproteobacteria bacterium]